eukprot:TRINITY_DN43416_c0_g1_i1.p1 TRINITY_DN43416_c0_g1~~TRINITY_DN43416_c0_g1_i1.p1  ORF type:complete len:853 (+),score=124.27 TRINITY_DN43416_c0_g1_i1:72-2561(+)
MALTALVLRSWTSMSQWSINPRDEPEAMHIKRMLAPVVMATITSMPASLFILDFDLGYIGACVCLTATGALAVGLRLLRARVHLQRLIEVVMVLCAVGTLCVDSTMLRNQRPRLWAGMIVLFDVCLLLRLHPICVALLLVLLTLWLILASVESVVRFGLLEAVGFGQDPVEVCDDPPCHTSAPVACAGLGFSLLVCLSDLALTRFFSTTMYAQIESAQATVDVVRKLTQRCTVYDVEGAEAVVNGEEGRHLPPSLRQEFILLLQCLKQYRPFLPDGVMCTADCDSDPEREAAERAMSPPGVELGVDPHVCIVFTDVEGSTELWEACPQGMFQALQLHNSLLRRVAHDNEGYEVKTIGDAFMLCFASALCGCRFGLAAQEQLVQAEWPLELAGALGGGDPALWNGLRVRIGIHYGPTRVEENPVTGRYDYYGTAVCVASRVETALRQGGLTGVTDAVVDELGQDGFKALGSPVQHELGTTMLKGISTPVDLTVLLPQRLAGRLLFVQPVVDAQPEACQPVQIIEFASSPRPRLSCRLQRSVATSVTLWLPLVRTRAVDKQIPVQLAVVERAADICQGVITAVVSGLCVVTYNATKACPDHLSQCVQFLDRVRGGGCEASSGCCTAAVLSGNVAGGRGRYATVFGGAVEMSIELAARAEALREFCLAAGAIGENCNALDRARRAEVWSSPPHTFIVYAVAPCASAGDDKWNFALQHSTTVTQQEESRNSMFVRYVRSRNIDEIRAAADSGESWATDIVEKHGAVGPAEFREVPAIFLPESVQAEPGEKPASAVLSVGSVQSVGSGSPATPSDRHKKSFVTFTAVADLHADT